MYQHKLCSAAYLPLDTGHLEATEMSEQPRTDLPSIRPSFKARSPSTKLSDFLRQAHPSRSASIRSRKYQKAGCSAQDGTSMSQDRPSQSSRFPSVRRMQRARPQLLPAFPSLSDDKAVTLRVEKPLPSEPPFDFEKFFRRPGTSTSQKTMAEPSEAPSVRSNASIHHFIRDCPKSKTAPVRYSFILQTDTIRGDKGDYPYPLTGQSSRGTCGLSPSENQPASANPILEGRTCYLRGDEIYRLGTPSLSPAFEPWPTSPCERVSRGRKRQNAHVGTARPSLSRMETDPLPGSVAGKGWVRDPSPTFRTRSQKPHMAADTIDSDTQLRATKSRSKTNSTELSLVCISSSEVDAGITAC